MADQSDVENALVVQVTTALYPNGTSTTSVSGKDYRIFRGWPNSSALNSDLSAGLINVTIFPSGEPGHNTTRYLPQWMTSQSPPTLTAAVLNGSVTFSGTAASGQIAGILVDGTPYVYRPQATDTPASVAGNLASAIRPNFIVNLTGSTLAIPGALQLIGRVVADSQASFEARRQRQSFRITCWCPDPTSRDACAIAIDGFLAPQSYLDLADGSLARLRYQGTLVFDQSQDALLYRRDLLYDVEYATISTVLRPAMLFGNATLNGVGSFG